MSDLGTGTAQAGRSISTDALHQKYLQERDKRLRPDGTRQYEDLGGVFAEFANDPYVEPGFTREPITSEIDVAVLGGGWAGLMTAASLHDAGVRDFNIIEQAGDFGGTWYWNRYPGIRCDIESYIYMPLLEEVGTKPSEKYAGGAEILAHAQAIGRHYDLYSRALFQTQVTSIRWSEEASRWVIRTNRDDEIKARYVIVGSGPLHRPKLPGIPGINDFKGRSFHSSRWDYEYTGGDSTGGLTRLTDKRVAIIGTGASTIQILPQVAEAAEEVYVFQRTPSAVDVRNNKPTDAEWWNSLEPGWQQRRKDNFVTIVTGLPFEEDMVQDRWTEVWSRFPVVGPESSPEALQLADYEKMEEIRGRIDTIVEDKATAESLKPWYNLFCKRPLYSDEYLQSFNRPNVHLVDTDGRGVDRITETGVEFDGDVYDVDLIVYATGFQAGAYTNTAGGYELKGRDNRDLSEYWAEGVRSLHGILIHGFPNFFIIGGIAQGSSSANYPHVACEQSRHVAALLARLQSANVAVAEITKEAERAWAETMAEKYVDRSIFDTECTPGYFNNEGNIKDRPSFFSSMYGGGPHEYVAVCNEWRRTSVEQDLDLTYQ